MEPSHDDGFKWFGEGFDGFPRRLPDNTVEYSLFVIKDAAQPADARARLSQLTTSINKYTKALLKDYIWQHDPFQVKISDSTISSRPCLQGRSNFGDSIADEWLIVYILVELSKQYPDLWIRVSDTDGEFLLIEAASKLPKWLNPEIAENRVWICNGHLRIVPLKNETQRSLELDEALTFIETQRQSLLIYPFVEDAAFARLKGYPAGIQDNLHHAMVSIPRRLASILHQDAAYVSPAIDAFYVRDAVAVRPLATKDISTLRFPPEDFVLVSVKFTKVGYAQLRGQVFDAPPSWIGISPRLHDEKVQMGMKLTCGFEMMLADPLNKDVRVVREIELLLGDIESGESTLPDDKEIEQWPRLQDDEKWLSIDYDNFEAELAGKAKKEGAAGTAQDNLHKMVSEFQQFMKADGDGDSDLDDDESEVSSTGEDKDGSFDDAEFEQAMKQMMGMSNEDREQAGLVEEARRLALADGDMNEEEEDEETQKMMQLIEEELKDAGSLRRRAKQPPAQTKSKNTAKMFGPELPPGFKRANAADNDNDESADEELGPGDEDIEPGDLELSSDDEDFNDVDVNLAKNLLQSFKGQAGASGPAGNMLRALGMSMPRDEDSD